MRLSFSPRALLQIQEIYLYIARHDRFGAENVRKRIYEIADFVARYPGAGHASFTPGLRTIPVNPHPYVVFFRVIHKRREVRMTRVVHGARYRAALREEVAEFRAQYAS